MAGRSRSSGNLRGLLVGTETNTRFLGFAGLAGDAIEPDVPTLTPEAEPSTNLEIGEDRIRFDVPVVMLESGARTQLGILIDTPNMTGADFTIEFDPTMVALRQISDGGFLSQGGSSIALVQNIDSEQGRAVVTVERPNLADAVGGQGQILELTLEVLAGGTSALRIRDVEIRSTGTPPRGAPATEIQITAP